uniref:histidine kinase n=1 Tax=Florenciella parvula TaxID=236787 RepID=A0A7S2CZD0_9STRA
MGHHLVSEFITEDFRASVQEVLDRALQGVESANFEFPLITKNGARVEVLLNATSRRDAKGRVVGVVGIGQDITARIAQEQEYIRLIDTANAPIFGVDLKGNVTVWNKCAADLTGYSADDTLGRHLVKEFITSDFRASVQRVLDMALQGVETANFEFPIIAKDGSKKLEVLLNATSRRDTEGRVVGMVGIGQDITDAHMKREAELKQREAEAARAAQSTISAHVYHEIRNVVGAVLALAERTRETVELALLEKSQEAVAQLPVKVTRLTDHQRIVCKHAVDTLNDMLDVAKMENGTYTPRSEVVDLGELCRRAAHLQGPRLNKGVEMKIQCPQEGECFILSDPVLLVQYLTNLLSNAAKFTAEGCVLVLCDVKPMDGQWVQITLGVGDSGPGIRQEDHERVLQAFTTGDAVPREDMPSTRSTGIGLRLANLIAQILGQNGASAAQTQKSRDRQALFIESPPAAPALRENLSGGGPGTYLFLNVRATIAPDVQVERHNRLKNSGGYQTGECGVLGGPLSPSGVLRVLVVDDQRTMRQMVTMLFQQLAVKFPGLRVVVRTALSGEEAARLVHTTTPGFHLITLDEQMSATYCAQLKLEQENSGASFDPSKTCEFDDDRLSNAKRRNAFFESESVNHDIEDGDGTWTGHHTISVIRQQLLHDNITNIPIMFNLTGNVLEEDRLMYMRAGSNGVLPKPCKMNDLLEVMEKVLPDLIEAGVVKRREDASIVTFDALCTLVPAGGKKDKDAAEEPQRGNGDTFMHPPAGLGRREETSPPPAGNGKGKA